MSETEKRRLALAVRRHPRAIESTCVRADEPADRAADDAIEANEESASFSQLGLRKVIEELLEAEVSDRLGRAARAAASNGHRTGRLKTEEGDVEYDVAQVRGLEEPVRSRVRSAFGKRTEALEDLAVEMYARGLSTRDIEAAVCDEHGRSLLSRTAVSQVTERLWSEYEAFATRDLAEFVLAYLFVDGIAERLRSGQPREAVLCAWGICFDGRKVFQPLHPSGSGGRSCPAPRMGARREGVTGGLRGTSRVRGCHLAVKTFSAQPC